LRLQGLSSPAMSVSAMKPLDLQVGASFVSRLAQLTASSFSRSLLACDAAAIENRLRMLIRAHVRFGSLTAATTIEPRGSYTPHNGREGGSLGRPANYPPSRTVDFNLVLRLERAAFGAGAETLIEVDCAAAHRNAGGRQLAGILIDDHRLAVGRHRNSSIRLIAAGRLPYWRRCLCRKTCGSYTPPDPDPWRRPDRRRSTEAAMPVMLRGSSRTPCPSDGPAIVVYPEKINTLRGLPRCTRHFRDGS
jgi:hypothetical protein